IVAATSRGWPIRPSGMMRVSACWLTPSGRLNCAMSGVSTPPGQTQLTRTSLRPYSTASARVSWTTPPFDAQYAALYGCDLSPATDAVFTIAPRVARMWGIPAWQVRNWPVRFTAIIRFHSSSVVSVVRRKKPMPATFARTCKPPWRRTASAIASVTAPGFVTSHGRATASPPAARIMPTISSAPFTSTSPQTTRPPSSPKCSAVALPMPEAAPVTKTERSSKRLMTTVKHVSLMSARSTCSRSVRLVKQEVKHVSLSPCRRGRRGDAGREVDRLRRAARAAGRVRVPRGAISHRPCGLRRRAAPAVLLAVERSRVRRRPARDGQAREGRARLQLAARPPARRRSHRRHGPAGAVRPRSGRRAAPLLRGGGRRHPGPLAPQDGPGHHVPQRDAPLREPERGLGDLSRRAREPPAGAPAAPPRGPSIRRRAWAARRAVGPRLRCRASKRLLLRVRAGAVHGPRGTRAHRERRGGGADPYRALRAGDQGNPCVPSPDRRRHTRLRGRRTSRSSPSRGVPRRTDASSDGARRRSRRPVLVRRGLLRLLRGGPARGHGLDGSRRRPQRSGEAPRDDPGVSVAARHGALLISVRRWLKHVLFQRSFDHEGRGP